MKKIFVFMSILLIGLTACTRQTPSPEPPALEPSPVPPTQRPTIVPHTSSSPTPPPTTVNQSCPPADPNLELPSASFDALPLVIAEFLNSGGTVLALDDGLYELGVASQPVAVAAEDLTGSGQPDIVVSIFDPRQPGTPPSGSLLVYTCQEGRYSLTHFQPSLPSFGAPGIRFVQDLNADGQAELVTASATCGAHTCFEEIRILSWNGERFENLLAAETAQIPFPLLDLVEDPQTGIFDLLITTTGAGSAGAGPQRSITYHYTFEQDGGMWTLEREELGESSYRIHVLHDADRAARDEDIPNAIGLYQRVIQDPLLLDWNDPQAEQDLLGAYARFRLLVLYYQIEQPDFAGAVLSEMENLYPPDHPQRAFVELAGQFVEGFERGDVAEGCRAARSYASDNPESILEGLGSADFGYANPDYTAEDICPW
jgi:hypothetical protein